MTEPTDIIHAPGYVSFTTWLLYQLQREDPVGDLAREWNCVVRRRLRGFRSQTPKQMYNHMKRMDACFDALLALEMASKEYGNPFIIPDDNMA